jgi:UDP-N-acetyl-D-mannosaminuronic acid transferase (WecB/TagA/CpsF family)
MKEEEKADFRTILGIRFFAGGAGEAVEIGLRGGLVVVPSAPVLVAMVDDPATREALLRSRLALTDSGLMVLLWNWLRKDRVPRVSGLEYLKLILDRPVFLEAGAMFWIMPADEALSKTLDWLNLAGRPVSRENFYVAPFYDAGAIRDEKLLETVSRLKPKHIFIAIGGGVQERLGLYLQENLAFRPGIHCIGAAIGFLTGDQVNIPPWADRWRLGWLLRCLAEPQKFIPRYWRARKLVPLLMKYRDRLPVSVP